MRSARPSTAAGGREPARRTFFGRTKPTGVTAAFSVTSARILTLRGWSWGRPALRRHRLLEVVVDPVEEADGREPFLVGADQQREVLGHVAGLDGVDADLLERRGELREIRVV